MGQVLLVPEDGDNYSIICQQYPEFTNNVGQYLFFISRLEIGLLSIQMMHGKTIHVTSQSRPEKWAKNYQIRVGQPPIQYKVLDIHAIRRVLDREGKIHETGIRQDP